MSRITNTVKDRARPWHIEDNALTSPHLRTLPAETRLHVESLIRDGVTIIPDSIPYKICERALNAFFACEKRNPAIFSKNRDPHGHYPRIVNLHLAVPELFLLFSENRIALDVQKAMFLASPCVYTSLFYERGSAQSIHRDTPYFSTRPEYFYLGVWVALEDTDDGNGPLQIMRGGHALPELDREALARKRFRDLSSIPPSSEELWNDYQAAIRSQCEAHGLFVEDIKVRKGDTVIWHPQLPHGGGPINDLRRSRFSIVMHTTPLGVPVYHQHAFFNPNGPFSTEAPWEYVQLNGWSYAAHRSVSFGHNDDYPPSVLA